MNWLIIIFHSNMVFLPQNFQWPFLHSKLHVSVVKFCKANFSLSLLGKLVLSVWFTVRWAWVALPPQWSPTLWRSTAGTWTLPLSTWKRDELSPNQTLPSWNSWRSIREFCWPGVVSHTFHVRVSHVFVVFLLCFMFLLFPSKQRHNKLWRSHSDSDLSDRPESVCKPSSHSLGRSDSHNNNTSPSLHHFLGVAVLQALGAEPEGSAKSNTTHTSDSQTHSNGVCESPVQEEVTSDCEDPLLLPLPRPRAATVVPEERLDNSASVAVTVPVAVPHPPPSLHILPPTPELQRAHRDPPTELFISLSKHKPGELSLNLLERSSSEEITPLTLGSTDSDIEDQSLSDSTNDKSSPLSASSTTPLPLVLSLAPSDDNNNPSEVHIGSAFDSRGEADGSSNHSADSIDFFSAREKFVGLAQDGRTRTLSEQAQQSPLSHEENEETDAKGEEDQGNESQVNLIQLLQNVFVVDRIPPR